MTQGWPSVAPAPAAPASPSSATWLTITNGKAYDQDEFYTKARNEGGYAEQVNVRLPTSLYDIANSVANADEFPYGGSVPALIRDALVHRIHYLETHADDPKLVAKLEDWRRLDDFEAMVSSVRTAQAKMEAAVSALDQAAQDAVKTEDWGCLWWMLGQTEEYAEGFREPFCTTLMEVVRAYRDQIPLAKQAEFKLRDRGLWQLPEAS